MRSKISMTFAAQKEPGNCFQMETLGEGVAWGVVVKRYSLVVWDLRGRGAAAISVI
jgi:hypothetical protein